MRSSYRQRINEGLVLFDGAIGTLLYDRGIFFNRCFEELNLSKSEMILDIYNEYKDAGAHALKTNTFGANPVRLRGHGLAEQTAQINKKAVELAREVAGDTLFVAGSVGPLGIDLDTQEDFSIDDARKAFTVQIQALIDAEVDVLLLETFTSVKEIQAAISAAYAISTQIPIQAQMAVSESAWRNNPREFLQKLVELDKDPRVLVVGINCTPGPALTLEIAKAMKTRITKPFSVMPNAGSPKHVDGRYIYLSTPEYFSEYALKIRELGPAVIGGCCGTTPAHIRKAGQAVLSLTSSNIEILKDTQWQSHALEAKALCERSQFGKDLYEKNWITTAELVPPMGSNLDAMITKTKALKKAGVKYINIPDGPRSSSRLMSLIAGMRLQQETGVEVIHHMCGRDKNFIGLQAEILGAAAASVHNILFVTGDPPKVGKYPDVTGVFDADSIELLNLAARLNRGVDLGGEKLTSPTQIVCGAGLNPVAQDIEREIDRAFRKAEAGVDFFISQPVFDSEMLLRFLEKIQSLKIPVLAGVWPLASYRNALFLSNEVPGVVIPMTTLKRMEAQDSKESAQAEGICIAKEMIEDIRHAVDGLQISPPFGRVQTVIDLIT